MSPRKRKPQQEPSEPPTVRHPPAKVRLMCIYCDTDDGDDQQEIPADWTEVIEVRSIESANAEEPAWNELHYSHWLNWNTHEGVCPKCSEKIREGEFV